MLKSRLGSKIRLGRASISPCFSPCRFRFVSLKLWLCKDNLKILNFCLCKNKGADQLCSKYTADQHLCFHYMDSTISLLPKSDISSSLPSSVAAQTGLCRTWSETQKTSLLASPLIYKQIKNRSISVTPVLIDFTKCLNLPRT